MSDLLYGVDGHVATITLNRPERLNAISVPMLDALSRALVAADEDRAVRVIVLTGAGKGFCSGLDLKDLAAGKSIGSDNDAMPVRFDLRNAPPIVLHQVDKPTLCALNGAAAGYGMDIALGCDIRIASDKAKFVPGFAKRGVLPESGGTWLLPRLVGWAKACEIAFSGRTLPAAECLELGLVNQVVPHDLFEKEVRALAERNRVECAARRAGDQAHDATRPRRQLRVERAPGLPATAAAVPHARLPGGREGVPRKSRAEVRGALTLARVGYPVAVEAERYALRQMDRRDR